MRITTMAPVAGLLLAVSACSWGSEAVTTSDDGQATRSPAEDDSGSGGGNGGSGGGGSGGSGGSGGDGGQGGQPSSPSTGAEEEPTVEEEGEPASPEGSASPDESEPTEGPIMLALGESHRFEDGFTVTMGPVERLTEPAPDRSDASTGEDPLDETSVEGEDEGTVDEPTMDEEESEGPEEEPSEEPVEETGEPSEEPAEESDDPMGEESPEESPEGADEETVDPDDEGPVDEEPTEGTEEEGDDYYAWSVEIANGTGEDLHTGSVLTGCAVGSPLTESSAPLLGTALSPPMALSSEESGSWDEDCWADEDDPTLQWTLEFIDEQGRSLYPVLIFEGRVD